MTEQLIGLRKDSNSEVKSLGMIIVIISLIQLVTTFLLFLNEENVSYIFVIIQNIAIIVFSFVFTMFSYKLNSTQQSLGTDETKLIFRYFIISQLISIIVIILYVTTVPIPQPKFDEEGVNTFYGIVTLLNGVTILNLIIYYLGVKSFRERFSFQQNLRISRKMDIGTFLSITAICSFFVANLPLLDAAIKFESSTNPIDPSVFIIHFLIAIALIFVALGLLILGMILEVFAGYEILRKNG